MAIKVCQDHKKNEQGPFHVLSFIYMRPPQSQRRKQAEKFRIPVMLLYLVIITAKFLSLISTVDSLHLKRDGKGGSRDVQGILRTAWGPVCEGTLREDPGMSTGSSGQHGGLCVRGHYGRILGCPRDPPDSMGPCV